MSLRAPPALRPAIDEVLDEQIQSNTNIRLLTLATAATLVLLGRSTVSIMAATCLFLVLATFLHGVPVNREMSLDCNFKSFFSTK